VTYDFNDGPTVAKTLVLSGVDTTDAVRGRLLFNTSRVSPGDVLRHRWNGGVWREYVVPAFGGTWERQGFAIDIDVADLVDGDNTLELGTTTSPGAQIPNGMQVYNIDLEIEAG
jgi:hypothetical protein